MFWIEIFTRDILLQDNHKTTHNNNIRDGKNITKINSCTVIKEKEFQKTK